MNGATVARRGAPGSARSPQAWPPTGRRASALRWAVLALLLVAAVPPCRGQGLDSLNSHEEGGSLFIGFAIPIQSLREARLDDALEERGLSVDCVVSTEVRKKERFGHRMVVREVVRRTLSYSRWYEEYVLTENAREIATQKSYYASLDRFRRFTMLHVVDLGILEPGEEYTIQLEVALVPRPPSGRSGGEDVKLAGVLPKEMMALFRGKGSLLSIRMESPAFRPGQLPGRLFTGALDLVRSSLQP